MPLVRQKRAGIPLDAFLASLLPDIQGAINSDVGSLQETLRSDWVNPDNAFPHVDGTPSESMGASSGAISVDIKEESDRLLLEFNIDGSAQHVRELKSGGTRVTPVEDYYMYARRSGLPEGESLRRAKAEFTRKGEQITQDAWTWLRARLEALTI